MSAEAFQLCEQAGKELGRRFQARHIRTKVNEARQSPHLAAQRWPFELLQNALDAGPRAGRDVVTVRLRHDGSRFTFEHDGAPFSARELTALLSGGSSKEFESQLTTGRFGSGFLVTHVLSEHTTLEGLLSVMSGCELFRLSLDRGGNEDAILTNIDLCNQAIRDAIARSDPAEVPSARFVYSVADDDTFDVGVAAFRSALPYLFGTCTSLGSVTIHHHATDDETWTASDFVQSTLDGNLLTARFIHRRSSAGDAEYRILRFTCVTAESASALVLLERAEQGWRVVVPTDTAPRIYKRYPLRASGFLPINYVLDGEFQPDEQRSRVLMNSADKEAISQALDAAIVASSHAISEGFEAAHLLARATRPSTGFDPDDVEERHWWHDQLRSFATRLADLPLVRTAVGMLPAADTHEQFADFVSPRLNESSTTSETGIARMWPLLDRATNLFPPTSELADDWSAIGEGWAGLGVRVNLVTAQLLADYVRSDVDMTTSLQVEGDPYEWLVRFIDVVGECWRRRGGVEVSVLEGLVPDQKGQLRSPGELRLDSDVPDELKDICEIAGLQIREGLVSERLIAFAREHDLRYVEDALRQAVPTAAAEDDVAQELLEHLTALLPEDIECSADSINAQRGTNLFLDYLWRRHGAHGAVWARKVPLVSRRGRVVVWSAQRMLMAPALTWHETARPFCDAYPPNRVLADTYAGTGELPNVVPGLLAWGLIFADPISTNIAVELQDSRLAAMVDQEFDSGGVVIKGEQFSQIALLQPEIINRCREGPDEARALLGLLLCHVARHDPAWRDRRTVIGRRDGTDVSVSLRGALWLGDLRSRAWVPVPGEDGKPAQAVASATTLTPLLDAAWIANNDDAVALLSECFGFDALELRLLGLQPEVQEQVRESLAKILSSGGSDPAVYEAIADEIEKKQRRSAAVDRCRRIGLAVQGAVEEALVKRQREGRIKTVKLVDCGFDFEVEVANSDPLEDGASHFEIDKFLVEVKATTTGPVRLTPKQATTASSDAKRFVLCVVDLREVDEERLDGPWTGDDVESRVRFVTAIGKDVRLTWDLIELAKDSDITIRNDLALRYEIPVEAWKGGLSLDDWLDRI